MLNDNTSSVQFGLQFCGDVYGPSVRLSNHFVEYSLCSGGNAVYMAIRGTDHSLGDWFNNIRVFPRKNGVHRGWYDAAWDLYNFIPVTEKPLILCGHSRGGAIAAILFSLSRDIVSKCITFGSPLSGVGELPRLHNYRIKNDPVTHLFGDPRREGFSHIELPSQPWWPPFNPHSLDSYTRALLG